MSCCADTPESYMKGVQMDPHRGAIIARLAVAAIGALALFGCGAQPGGIVVETAGVNQAIAKLGFGAEGGSAPSLFRRTNGTWVVAYVGTNVGDRRIYWASSPDGRRWSKSQAVGEAEFADQAPALAEDAAGHVHLFFASNRDGVQWELFHARFVGATFATAEPIKGFTGTQDLAVTLQGDHFVLAAEIMGAGLVVATSKDGSQFAAQEPLTEAGFEPTATTLPDGRALVAYTRSGEVYLRAGKAGGPWGTEQHVASGSDRLREPNLAWGKDGGQLVFAERGPEGYQLRARTFDAALEFSEGPDLPMGGGEARGPAIAFDHNGRSGLAWGIKTSSGQQGIVLAMPD